MAILSKTVSTGLNLPSNVIKNIFSRSLSELTMNKSLHFIFTYKGRPLVLDCSKNSEFDDIISECLQKYAADLYFELYIALGSNESEYGSLTRLLICDKYLNRTWYVAFKGR